ncbi:MAG: HEAT repeat domain-containing protein [Candidatus Zixiibacteriota bacterium]|nr:MAG: HEAT repeat domain-containing protein [candidate division Zixibacteria bacterium]
MDLNDFETKQKQKIEDFGLIVRDLLKVIKVVSMYPDDNPLPKSLRRSFSERLESLVEQYGETRITVHRDHLTLGGETIFTDRSREESLAGLFFKTGITVLVFKEGFEVLEIYRFLDVIKDYLNSPGQNRDLAALMWEANIAGFQFTTIEDIALAEYDGAIKIDELFAGGDSGESGHSQIGSDSAPSYDAIFRQPVSGSDGVGVNSAYAPPGSEHAEDAAGRPEPGLHVSSVEVVQNPLDLDGMDAATYQTSAAADAMGLGEVQSSGHAAPDTNIILNDELRLTEEDTEYIDSLSRGDAEFEPYESTCELVKELLHQESEMSQFYESVTVGEKVLYEVIEAGQLIYASRILGYFKELEDELQETRALWAERLKEARIAAGSRDRLKGLSSALNGHESICSADLRRYLNHFGWEALSGLTDLLGELEHEHQRDTLVDYLTERGGENSHVVAKGLSDRRWEVVRNSVYIMCRIGDAAALKQLGKVVSHKERQVRLALVQSLSDCSHNDALGLLKQAVRDADREVRSEAVKSIVARRGPAAFETITEILNDDSFGELDSDGQQSILNAFSTLGGDQAVGYLVGLITRLNPLGDSSLSFYRQAAFEALSFNRSDRCERALVKLASSWRPDIKQQAAFALNRRREVIYGDQDD